MRSFGLLLVTLGGLLFCPLSTQGAQSHWFLVGETDSPGGFGQAIASNGKDLFLLRQFLDNTPIEFQKLSLTAGLVTRKTNLPRPPHALQNGTALVADFESNLYALFGADNFQSRRFFGRYSAGRWVELSPTPLNQGAANAMAFLLQEGQRYLYAFVGTSVSHRSGARTEFLRFDITLDQWQPLGHPPWVCGGNGSALVWDGGEFVYAFQGSDCEGNPSFAFARYYLTLNLWEIMPPVPDAVEVGASLAWDGEQYIYALTGSSTQLQGRGFYRFDVASQSWDAPLPALNCSVGNYNGNRLAIVEGRITYWQGAPSNWADRPECNGRGFYVFTGSN